MDSTHQLNTMLFPPVFTGTEYNSYPPLSLGSFHQKSLKTRFIYLWTLRNTLHLKTVKHFTAINNTTGQPL